MTFISILGPLLTMTLASVSWAQRGKPLVMDAFKNGVYTFHMGKIVISARCAYTEVAGSDLAKPILGKCSAHHGPFEVPGDTVSAFQWENKSIKGTTRNDTSYETFPNGDLDVSELHSWSCVDGLPLCSDYRVVVYHFKVVKMMQQNKLDK
jgi:hypothetical protein